jgi:threonine synthase
LTQTVSFILELTCSRCGTKYDPNQIQTVCTSCQGTLFADYDLEGVKSHVSKESLRKREATMWRYRELLPVKDEENIVTLGEGYTPILQARKLGVGLRSLMVKDDGVIPTGTFKARGQSAAISKAKELGIKSVALASAGNAGGAAATYCARAGIECNIFMPRDAPESTKKECVMMGANLNLIDGLINDAARMVAASKEQKGWFELSTLKEPYRVEGKKTMGYEIAEQMEWRELPDVIIYPTGGGTGLVGMWKAFREIEALGWMNVKKPRMISVQSSGCAPVVDAWIKKKNAIDTPFPNAETIASGLRVPYPYASEQILKVIRESGGVAIAVKDAEILEMMRVFAKSEGMFVCPEGAAALAALGHLISEKAIDRDESVLLYNTGSGLKYLDMMPSAS